MTAKDAGEAPRANVATPTASRRMSGPLGITFFRLVAEHGSDIGSLHTRDGLCVFVAPSVTRAFGWPEDQFQGRPLRELVHHDDWPRVAEALAVEGEALGQVTYRLRLPSGETTWVETLTQAAPNSGRDQLVVCMTRDISHHRRATMALEEGVLALAMRQPDGVLVIQDGRILHSNPAAFQLLGLPTEAAVQRRRFAEFVHPDDSAREGEELTRIAQLGTVSAVHDLRFVLRDGTTLTTQTYAMGVSFGGAAAALLVVRDKPKLDTQAIIADRLRSIGAVATGLAQELAAPVALLLASLDVLASEEADADASAAKANALAQATSSGDRIFQALRSLRSFSRGDEDLRRTLDARDVVDAVLNVADGRRTATTKLVRDFAESPVFVSADQARLSQALLNLVANAVDAANERPDGEVRVSVRATTKGGALVEVSDNGPGIHEATLGRVFEPFFTTKPVATAAGLGLPISHAIIRALGGRLDLESAPKAGTIAIVQLPPCAAPEGRMSLTQPPASRATIRVAPAPAPPSATTRALPRVSPAGEKPRLLVMDDDVPLASTLQRLLRHEYDVVVETSAEAALRRIVSGERFDILLCDVMLPGMSGIAFYDELQRIAPAMALRVVFVTGGMNTPGTQAFLEGLPNPCIDKPFLPDDLRRRLRELNR